MDDSPPIQLTRLRITFTKDSAMRYTGHLDLHRAWERTFRRARLPLAYSQGYNPHPRLNLASALPLGFTSQHEILDAWIEQDLPTSQILEQLQPALPPGLQITQIESTDLHAPALQTMLDASEFEITFLEPIPELDERVRDLLTASSLPRRKRDKDYDLRPLIQALELLPATETGLQRLFVRLSAQASATGRPEELIEALGVDPTLTRVQRVRLVFFTG